MSKNDDQTERKVQLTGGSTYTVSLPKDWAQDHGVEPGTTVYLYTRGRKLIVLRGKAGDIDDRRSVVIDATTKNPLGLARSIEAAYIAGADSIQLDGLANSEGRRTARRAVRQFVGLEVMSEDENSLTARTMLDAADLSPKKSLEQIRRTTHDMHEGAIQAVTTGDRDLGKQVAKQDDTVDRLFALISREFQRSLVDPKTKLHRNGMSAFEYYMAARQLERVADHAEKIAGITSELDTAPPQELAESISTYGSESRAICSASVDALLDADTDLRPVIERAETLITELEQFDETLYESDNGDGYRLGIVLDSILRTIQYGVNIAEAGIQAQYREQK